MRAPVVGVVAVARGADWSVPSEKTTSAVVASGASPSEVGCRLVSTSDHPVSEAGSGTWIGELYTSAVVDYRLACTGDEQYYHQDVLDLCGGPTRPWTPAPG